MSNANRAAFDLTTMKDKETSYHSDSDIYCHICDSPKVERVPGYEAFRRITSDCKLWSKGGQLYICCACGCVQKAIDEAWQSEVEQIYAAYSVYDQSGGAEQAVFEQTSGLASSRSARLLTQLQAHIPLPERGRLLDIGCGNGSFLRTFSTLQPGWTLAGADLGDKYRSLIERIDGVEALYTCDLEEIPGTFNLIAMIHSLEHIPDPKKFLARLWNKLEVGGLYLVQLPDCSQNPFDLVLADHCTHFTKGTLAALLQSAGYEVISAANDWVPKELTVVARKSEVSPNIYPQGLNADSFDPFRNLEWLDSFITEARELSTKPSFGLFGTSIAATWLFGELDGQVSFFVDEDLQRVGKTYMERPIYHPRDVPSGSDVLIALPTQLAEGISRRIARPDVRYHLPPNFTLESDR